MQGSKTILIILFVVIFMLIGAIGFGTYLVFTNSSLNTKQENITQESYAHEPAIYKASINDMVLNVTNSRGREKLMKLSFTIKSTDEMIEQVVNDNLEVIKDRVIHLTSSRSTEELLTVGGKALLKEELRDEINSSLNRLAEDNEDLQKNMIHKILYTSFVIK